MYHYLSRFTVHFWWKQSIHLPYKHDPNNVNGIHVFFFRFCRVLYQENSTMRFVWHHDNGKMDHISQLQHA